MRKIKTVKDLTAQRAIELWNDKQADAGADKPSQPTPLAEQASRAAAAFQRFGEALAGKVEEPEFPNEQELEPYEVTSAGVIVGVLISLGILFLIGAVGTADFTNTINTWYFVKIALGFVLIGAGFFIAAWKGRKDDEKDD